MSSDWDSGCQAASSSSGPRPSLTLISTRTGRRTSIHHDTEFADRMNAYIVSPLIPLPKPQAGRQRRRNPTLDRLLQPPKEESSATTNSSPSQQLLGKLRSLKLRLQRHASMHGRGWPPREFVLMQESAARSQSSRADQQQPLSASAETSPVDGIVCTESDIRCIVSDLLLRQDNSSGGSSSGNNSRQLIGVVPLPPPESPNRRLVCFIDPKSNQLAPDSGSMQVCHSCLRPLPVDQQKLLKQQQQPQQQQQQPKEVLFDENGQTWEVYGADLDPDLLGQAIQNHLAAVAAATGRRESSELEESAAAASF